MNGHEIRRRFLEYFASRGHERVASAPLVPEDDPTLLFVNAGMVPFKDVFTGQRKVPYDRAVSSQKCLRVSGKHNDFENVGYTPRHHTFFEMLGNFSFGDYFKRDAIAFAWEFLTVDLGLPADRLWASVHENDDEAARLWPEATPIPAERVIRLGDESNFWAMGETGPCGPCSEIFYDFGPDLGPGTPADNEERYLEIWNLVFMQFDRSADGTLTPLPAPSVDTGMGLERIAAVVQGVYSNYESDLFTPILDAIAMRIGRAYEPEGETGVSFRVLADHVRAATFLIGDGVYPSNEGRGYVLRRIIRRAVRHYWLLDVREPVLCDMAPAVVAEMSDAYGELAGQKTSIASILRAEEERFLQTIDRGMEILEGVLDDLGAGDAVPGEEAFRLYDTYGFPPDLTELIARERGHGVDHAGYATAMERQREQSRAGSQFVLSPDDIHQQQTLDSTEIRLDQPTTFVGYDTLDVETIIEGVARLDDRQFLVLRESPFYAAGGGQVADTGTIEGEGFSLRVVDVQRQGESFFIRVELATGDPAKVIAGAAVRAIVDEERRADVERHHTVTHVLHAILRRRIGDHVRQAGSLVAPDRMRFDFSSPTALAPEEIRSIEDEANEWVLRDLPVTKEVVPIAEARARGAMALFGEKYGDTVRVVTIGDRESIELCGGCHVDRTGEIGAVRIMSESSAAAGVRRIEVVTGRRALEEFRRREALLAEAAARLRVAPEELPGRIERLLDEKREVERSLETARRHSRAGADSGERTTTVDGFQVLTLRAHPMSMDDLRAIGDSVRSRLESGVGVIGAEMEGKAHLLTVVTDDLIKAGKLDAPRVVRELAAFIGGGGGGKKHMAQAGGKDVERIDEALERAPEIVGGLVGG
ncbi:MAG TPA: alanine--tRNA ligase [Gemmatimonadota bacterium]|nr:alanine--tRNA ligase [Gemmatimonadota bacterium]